MECETCQDTGLVDLGCGGCSGTGEGMYDGGVCTMCKGTGSYFANCPEEDCTAIKMEEDYDG